MSSMKNCLNFIKLLESNNLLNDNTDKVFRNLGTIIGSGFSTYAIKPREEFLIDEFSNYDIMVFTTEKIKYYYLNHLIPNCIKYFNYMFDDNNNNNIINYIADILDSNNYELFYSKKFENIYFSKDDRDYIDLINIHLDNYCVEKSHNKYFMNLDEMFTIIDSIHLISGNLFLKNAIKNSLVAIFECIDIEFISNFDLHENQFLYDKDEDRILLIDPMVF